MPSFIHSSTGATQAHPGLAVLPHDPTCRPSRVALVGAYGYGASHLRRIGELVEQGVAELCAVADPRPPSARVAALPDAPWYSSLEGLLARGQGA